MEQPDDEKTTINSIMEMCQKNIIVIHNLTKDVVEIMKNTLRNDGT